jgi:hypothetical protein
MKFIHCFFIILMALIIASPEAKSQENQILQPIGSESPTDLELKDLVWNRYTSNNFVIMSIDNAQGKWMSENINKIKTWCIERWGFPDFQFTKECRVFCVPNKSLCKKLFNLDDSKVEIRRKNGEIEITAMWLILDDKPARIIPKQLTQVCFAEFEQKHNVTIPFFAKNGIRLLNGISSDIRSDMIYLGLHVDKDQPIFISEKMFLMTEDEYENSSLENKKIFDSQSIALCLLLRKEFGETKMQGFLRMSSKNDPKDVLLTIYGFTSYAQFDQSYLRYIKDLSREVSSNKTPDSYLEISPVKR